LHPKRQAPPRRPTQGPPGHKVPKPQAELNGSQQDQEQCSVTVNGLSGLKGLNASAFQVRDSTRGKRSQNQIYFFVAVPSTSVIQFVPSSDRSYFIV
jgi:hypothetical protein